MGGIGCKVVLCICSAAQSVERGNTLLAYRVSESESIEEHPSLIEAMRIETLAICSIIHDATRIAITIPTKNRRALPVVMREAYETFLANDDKFTEQQIVGIIYHGNAIEKLGQGWNDKLLKDAGYLPS